MLNLKKKKVKIKNGETLSYVEAGDKTKETVLLVHGNFLSSMYYIRAIKHLSKHYHVLAPDMRGYGDSTYLKRVRKMTEFSDDMILFMDEMGIKDAYVTGWSMGGCVVMEMAAHYPERVKKIVLVGSGTHKGYPLYKKDENNKPIFGAAYSSPEEMAIDEIEVLPILTAQRNQDYDLMSKIVENLYVTIPSAEEHDLFVRESMKQVNLLDADWAITTINMSHESNAYGDGEGTIDLIQCPALHFWGSEDTWLAPEYMTLDNHLAMKDSTYIRYENCGHMIFIDKDKEACDEMIKFFKK